MAKSLQTPHPPILFGGATARGRARVVRYYDGWMPIDVLLDDLPAALADLRYKAAATGRDPDSLSISVLALLSALTTPVSEVAMTSLSAPATWTTEYVPGTPRLAVDRQGTGPLLVFLHGIGGNRTNWHDQLPVFAKYFTAIAWDARGYGLSDDYDGPLNPLDFAHDLKRLLDHYSAPQAHLAGLSMGGTIAQDFYSLYPDRVATLVLCDTSDGLNRTFTPAQREEFVRLRIGPLLAGKEPQDMAPTVADTLIGRQSSRASWQRLVDSMAALHKESYIKTVRANTTRTAYPDAHQINVPTLLVFGEDDRLTPPEIGRAMHAKIPGSQFVLIPTAGHLSNIEQPDAFNRAVLDFLQRAA